MKTFFQSLLVPLCLTLPLFAAQTPPAAPGELLVREIQYDGRFTDHEARFAVTVDTEATGKTESAITLFEGDVALLPARLPDSLRIIRDGNRYTLTAPRAGKYKFTVELVAKIHRAEPWNQINFTGPVAAIASLAAQASGAGMEVQLQSGTLIESVQSNGVSRVRGLPGADRLIALRWQGKVTEVARKALITAETSVEALATPTVIKYTTHFRFDLLQGNAPRLTFALPASHALTRITGEQIRDWQLKPDGDRQLLTVEFIKPVEKNYSLTLHSEQALENLTAAVRLDPPQPLDLERESGAFTVSAEDMLAETETLTALRQVNATGGALAAYRFNARPFTLALKLKRIEPLLTVADRASVRMEETRLLVTHQLSLNVEKAGIYNLELTPQPGLVVADVRGEGVEDWKVTDNRLRVNFSARVLGTRKLEVQLEQTQKTFPEQFVVSPLRVTGATKETTQIGAASAPGIRLKTAEVNGLREVSVRSLPPRAAAQSTAPSDELLAYNADAPDWKLTLASERLAARIVADVFNLVTIGNGLVGGSATIRYGIVNQGVQEFRVKLPEHCRNVEFTAPNIRRRELKDGVWHIGLQDKAWDGYTLVVTYDHQFDPKGATLPVGGIHTLDVERETGSVALTTAASLKLSPKSTGTSLRRVDESELAAADRALITRAVVLAYQYAGDASDLTVDVKRHEEIRVLEAVADRTQITSVLNQAGEMLTQASFMVKNNAKQFQGFQLPKNADFWGCYVNGQPVKPERDGDWVLVPLPRDANRDQVFAVDIVYAQTNSLARGSWSRTMALTAPRTDVPNTYAEWQLYVPNNQRLSDFGGSMAVAQGTTYGLVDAWQKFLAFYLDVLREAGVQILIIGVLAFLVVGLVVASARRGVSGVLTTLAVMAILAILAAMMLPALSKAKARAQRINSVNNLKQIGLAARQWSLDNNDRYPATFEEMMNELGTDKILTDPDSGQRYTYLGAFVDETTPEAVLAYSAIANGQCNVLFADGSVQMMTAAQFAELAQRGLVRTSRDAAQQQLAAVRRSQLQAGRITPPAPLAQVPAVDPATGLPVANTQPAQAGAIGGGGGGAVVAAPPAPAPRGLRSIRIEIPREGNSFAFTKVLNIGNIPLSISADMMSVQTYRNLQMVGQMAAFLAGLGLWLWQWRRSPRNSFLLTCALTLMLGAVGNLLVQWHALHDALIVGFPALVVAIIAWVVWNRARRRKTAPAEATPPPLPGTDPALAAWLLLGLLAFATSASAQTAKAAAPDPQLTAPRAVSIISASYAGTVNDRVALLDVTLQCSASQAPQQLALFGEDVAVQQFTVKGGSARLVREGNNVAVRLGKSGLVTLQLKLVAKIGGDVTKRRLQFAIPPALSSQVALTLDQAEADVDFPTAISFQRTADRDKTRVDAVIGSGGSVELLWTPRVKRAAEVAATVFCQNNSLVTVAGGVVGARSVLDYQVTQGELRTLRVRVPAGQRLLRVEGESIRTWEVRDENGAQTLVVELLKGISPAYRLTVETEKSLEPLPVSTRVETAHALDVKRESGLVALRGGEELTLSVEAAQEMQRVDAEEFARTGRTKAEGFVSVFRFLKPDYDLRARAETVQPQIEAQVRNHVRVAADQLSVSATIDYSIKRAGVFTLRLALPAGYRVEHVTGAHVQQWNEHDGRLEVALKERTLGNFTLRVELSRSQRELPETTAIVGVLPLDTSKLTGFVSVLAEAGVAVKTAAFEGLSEIPAISLPDGASLAAAGVLAYKFISTAPQTAPPWSLSVNTESVAAWVRAEVAHSFTIGETLVSGRAQVRFDVANAPVKELNLKIPAALKNVEITGPNIRRRDQQGEIWRIELQNKVRGNYTLTVNWEQARDSKTNRVELIPIAAERVERETGLLAIAAKAPLQVAEIRAVELTRVDTGEFPEWAGRPDDGTVLAYRYVRAGHQLALEARRFDEAAVLQALADSLRLTTVVSEDGQAMTELAVSVRNNGRQFLEIELPAGAEVWSAFVAGQPVRPSKREGKLLLPLQEWGADDEAVTVELTYAGTNAFPRVRGALNFVSPKLDVPLKNARWELFLPQDFAYEDFAGTMTREIAASPSILNFSLSEYLAKEKSSWAQYKEEAKKDVSKAQSNLSSGNLRGAVQDYNRAKGKYRAGKDEAGEVQKLELQLRNFQATNLVNAQQAFSSANNGVMTVGQVDLFQNPVGNNLNYDNAAAEAQWTKLAQAQEVAAAKVQPLRVNLPLRGLRYSFTQVLQTEVNKPLTVHFSAANAKTGSWLTNAGLALVGFLALWALMAAFTGSKFSHRPATA